jgi:transposase InsO family protein
MGSVKLTAMCASFFGTLECELLGRRWFKMQTVARIEVFEFIEGFYNLRRRHSSIGYLFRSNTSVTGQSRRTPVCRCARGCPQTLSRSQALNIDEIGASPRGPAYRLF